MADGNNILLYYCERKFSYADSDIIFIISLRPKILILLCIRMRDIEKIQLDKYNSSWEWERICQL